MQRNYDFIFKVVFVGPSGVGKTALLRRYADDSFDENLLPTIGVDFKFK
jgi:GTPase SAR1 family protein